MMCVVLAGLAMTSLAPVAYASGPGGNVSDPVVRAVDIAKPAVVRILTQVVGRLTVTFKNGQSVTFPQTPQQGLNGYPLDSLGSGAFISAHGDILTADHVINPVQDDKQSMDQFLDQTAASDVAAYMNQHLQQQVTADQVTQELISGQLPSAPQYDKPQSQIFLSTDFSGPIAAASFQALPRSQYANVDQIKASSPFTQFDTAIIHVSGMDNMPMLQLGDATTVQEQDQLRIIGFPGNGDVNTAPNDFLTSSINIINVSSIKTSPGGGTLIQVGGNVEQGDSGGPALDNNGHVVGIVSFGTSTTGGGTSFLRASSSAKQLMQQAGVDTTPSALQVAWSKAFNDYASNTPGHWHLATSEFQQLLKQYPLFKAVNTFLPYAAQQAQSERQTGTSTPTTSTTNPAGNSAGGVNPAYVLIGGLVVLVILVFGGAILISRRRHKTTPVAAYPPAGYGAPSTPAYPGAQPPAFASAPVTPPAQPGQPAPFAQPGQPGQPIPQTPAYPGQMAYPQAARPQAPAPAPQAAYPSQIQPPQPSPSASSIHSGMAAFGAPGAPVPPQASLRTPAPGSVMPATSSAADATLVARPGSSGSQWRIWPCGHTNRYDASFCGTCGESAPPAPLVRRLEQ
jgi:S1-C subfamily serine protease